MPPPKSPRRMVRRNSPRRPRNSRRPLWVFERSRSIPSISVGVETLRRRLVSSQRVLTDKSADCWIIPSLIIVVQTCCSRVGFAGETVGLTSGCSVVLSVGLVAVGEDHVATGASHQPRVSKNIRVIVNDCWTCAAISRDLRDTQPASVDIIDICATDEMLEHCLCALVSIHDYRRAFSRLDSTPEAIIRIVTLDPRVVAYAQQVALDIPCVGPVC